MTKVLFIAFFVFCSDIAALLYLLILGDLSPL
jgi:hypothetical protein